MSVATTILVNYKMNMDYQKNILNNLEYFYTVKVNTVKIKVLTILGLISFVGPICMLTLTSWLLTNGYMDIEFADDDARDAFLFIVIFGFFGLLALSCLFLNYINLKYTPIRFLQNPLKEQKYRWAYRIIFNDELSDYEEWQKNLLNKPVPFVSIKPIFIDRPECIRRNI